MTNKNAVHVEFQRRIDEVLFYKWDPIGVSDQVNARNEYHGYALQVFSLIHAGKSVSDVAAYLAKTVREEIGMDAGIGIDEHAREVSELIFKYKDAIEKKHRDGSGG